MYKISIITPTIRENGMAMLRESLLKQTLPKSDWEWIVCSPFRYDYCDKWIPDPPKNEGDLYGYHKAINELIKVAEGELIICVNDMTALFPDVLEKFWKHFQEDPMKIYCGLGNPEVKEEAKEYGQKWLDIRWNYISQPIQATNLINFDTALSGIPKKALDVIGYPAIDPVYDQYACWGDREMLVNVMKQGYRLFIDSTINFDGFTHMGHPEMKDWDERFKKGEQFFATRNGGITNY